MASFSGTQAKCKSCGKTVYPMEQVVAEGVIFHKGCFRCSHCKSTLKLNNFVSLEGVFYCKPHFEQLYQATGSFAKSFDNAIKTERENPPPPESITGDAGALRYLSEKKEPSPIASKFGGTQEKCQVCTKTVYPLEKITVESTPYHKACFKCTHGGCTLTNTNFKTHVGKLYCTYHFNQLVLIKGNFSTLQISDAERDQESAQGVPESSAAQPTQRVLSYGKDVKAEEEEKKLSVTKPVVAKSAPAPAKAAPSPPKPPAKPAVDDDDDDDEDDDDE